MSARTIQLTDPLRDYLVAHSVRDRPYLADLRDETAEMTQGQMQICPEQGQLMTLLTQLVGATRALEIGTFTGYSSLCIAMGLPADGRLVCLDRSEEWTAVARRYWQRAGLADRIELRLGEAMASLDALIEGDDDAGRFDLAFVDADKANYPAYHERCLQLLRSGGVILYDNVLWGGSVIDPDDTTDDTVALRALNEALHADERIDLAMVPIGDGLTLCRKR